ncbi:hypothetical protein MA16_Dca011920 [Dendrobium catenatum]|uniref:Reverse transcriptase zinc-binding domain-containing protein n=1 Tax=Dendrobium catenatum TaxID=906689 RepID=A0A2I0W2M1_9ASPA|nr:hypothetical protein MA16_Dca011920 [Dendrobium catenatum]
MLCDLSKDGKFHLKSAWHSFREKGNIDSILPKIWHKSIPATVSIFVWRVLHKFIPMDDNLIKKGFSLTSKCQCCFHTETMHHVLFLALLLLERGLILIICLS